MALIPITYSASVPGLLLVSDSPIIRFRIESIKHIGEVLSVQTGSVFHVLRNERFKELVQDSLLESETFKEEIKSFLDTAEAKDHKVAILHLDFAQSVDFLSSRQEQVDSFRVFKDIRKVVASMLYPSGRIIDTGEYRLLILMESTSIHDYSLITHQISMALKEFFQTPQPIEIETLSGKAFPENGTTIEELLPSFLL